MEHVSHSGSYRCLSSELPTEFAKTNSLDFVNHAMDYEALEE